MATWTDSRLPRRLILAGLVLSASFALAGCAKKEDIIPQDGPDMLTIYGTHMQSSSSSAKLDEARDTARARPVNRDHNLRDWTRDAANEIEQLFPLLPNPMMVLYVFPHLSGEGAPVPGYTTAFRLYAVDQFAMPGEMEAP